MTKTDEKLREILTDIQARAVAKIPCSEEELSSHITAIKEFMVEKSSECNWTKCPYSSNGRYIVTGNERVCSVINKP